MEDEKVDREKTIVELAKERVAAELKNFKVERVAKLLRNIGEAEKEKIRIDKEIARLKEKIEQTTTLTEIPRYEGEECETDSPTKRW